MQNKEKVLWRVHWNYFQLSEEKYSRTFYDDNVRTLEFTRKSREQWDFLHRYYYYCTQIWSVYDSSFRDFVKCMEEAPDKWGRRKRPWWGRWWRWPKSVSSYARQPEHQKKVLTEQEQARRDWREKKQFRRDSANQHYSRGPKTYFKRLSNHMHRQWERKKLAHFDFDFNDKDYKYFCDPWMWN